MNLISRFLFWVDAYFLTYTRLVFIRLRSKELFEDIVDMMTTDLNIPDNKRVELRQAMRNRDFDEVEELVNGPDIIVEENTEERKEILEAVVRYQKFYIALIGSIAIILLVLLFK